MHFTNTILQLGVFAASVSAFYPYYPEYKCIEDGTCLESSKRLGGSNALENAIHKGAFEMKIKKSIAKVRLSNHVYEGCTNRR